MIGAILGDIVGSSYEFDRGEKIKDFGPLFSNDSCFTDDSIMTVAVADALMKAGVEADTDVIKREVTVSMKEWGKKYPDAGYGSRFGQWLNSNDEKPYGSYGNGSAMRVSPVGWLYDSIERTREVARATAETTHNHPEGIKGAEATASAIYLARTGSPKEEIREYIIHEFGYDFSRTLEEIRPGYHHMESCQETVPEAMTAFFEGNGFEDVVRNAVSLGGDCDTLTCIAAGIAETFYGIPKELEEECRSRLSEDLLRIVDVFHSLTKGILFRYELCDAWFIPKSSITVYDDGKVEYFLKSADFVGESKIRSKQSQGQTSCYSFTSLLIKSAILLYMGSFLLYA